MIKMNTFGKEVFKEGTLVRLYNTGSSVIDGTTGYIRGIHSFQPGYIMYIVQLNEYDMDELYPYSSIVISSNCLDEVLLMVMV